MKKPFVMLLVGTPLTGKTTWIRNNYPNTPVISRDEIVMEVYGSRNYSEAFAKVDHKEVDRVLHQRLQDVANSTNDVIVDMTNLTPKRRKHTLSYFSNNFTKIAVVFPTLSDEEYIARNKKRIEEEQKDLPMSVIKSMISTFEAPTTVEGFDEIIFV
jgi:predicted kinase